MEPRKPLMTELLKPKNILLLLIGYGALLVPFLLDRYDYDLELFFRQGGIRYLSMFISMGVFLYIFFDFYSKFRKTREERFSDVDARRRESDFSHEFQKILNELEEIKSKQEDVNIDELKSKLFESRRRVDQSFKSNYKDFKSYFNNLKSLLEEQIQIADEKASILLDKGTAFARGGIVFFVITIIIWQILSWYSEFKPQFIYGIVSCSLLFVFIEFLSAWFLKQYRNFVDTSTYLVKVKSIFDKYMLSYLFFTDEIEDKSPEAYSQMFVLLGKEIKWPESYLLKKADISFAKEAFESLTTFTESMKNEVKNVGSNSKSASG